MRGIREIGADMKRVPGRSQGIRPFPALFLFLAALPMAGFTARAQGFDAGKAAFRVQYKREISPYRINAVFLMPGEVLDLEAEAKGTGGGEVFRLEFDGVAEAPGHLETVGSRGWKWKAPDSAGLYPFRIHRAGDTVAFNAFVMVPAAEMRKGYLRGYHIGTYPRSPLKRLEFYRPPEGFVKADLASSRALVSPHFRLSQFLCKQSPDLPAYVVLKERLLLKLEMILEKANDAGYPCRTFHVMSGYRTPFYNHLIGNVKFSAHQFGGAADIFIDANPEDGEMDDLNGDGRSDGEDSALLFKLVDRMSLNRYFLPYIGGIGKYNKNASHGAFVHVDVRGFRAIW